MAQELYRRSATELANLIAARRVSVLDVVDDVLVQLERVEPLLNAFVTTVPEAARAAARRADAELALGQYRGPLHGVPISLKDLFWTAGVRTTGGSRLLEEWVPTENAAIVERLDAAGAILIGKTNLDEFGHGGTSTLSHFGPVHNPWDLECVAGGSSGGSAAAVAVGVGPISYGTETASSVRRPAALSGVVGVKPTFGVISRYGSFRTAWSLDHVGVFGRSVADATLGLDAVAGFDPRDPASVRLDRPPLAPGLQAEAAGLRVGVLQRFADDSADAAVREAFAAAVDVLHGLGAVTREVDVPELRHAAMTSMLTSEAESAAYDSASFREHGHLLQPAVRRSKLAGWPISASEYLTIQRARRRIREAVRAAWHGVDLLVAPTMGRTATPIRLGQPGLGDSIWEPSYNQVNLLRGVSLVGLPACSVPCGFDDAGKPIGIQIISRWFDEQTMLNVAAAYEAATAWHERWPAVATAATG